MIFNKSNLLFDDNKLWIGSKDYDIGRGITRLNTNNFQADHYDFDITVNMSLTEVHSIYNFDSGQTATIMTTNGDSVIQAILSFELDSILNLPVPPIVSPKDQFVAPPDKPMIRQREDHYIYV